MKRIFASILFVFIAFAVNAQTIVDEHPALALGGEIPAGNYSGITCIGENLYAIVDDKAAKDGFYVCNHDETVKYQSGEEKKVSSSDLAELLASPLKNDKTEEDVYLCTFERYLEICKSGEKIAVIELKEDFFLEEIREILDIVERVYDLKSISVISFYFNPLLLIKEAYPTVDVQYLSETKKDPIFEKCLEKGVSIDVRQSILTKKMVKQFHEAGLKVNTWTVNKKRDLFLVRFKGVDYVTTDLFCKE